jgi:hypothetical protein
VVVGGDWQQKREVRRLLLEGPGPLVKMRRPRDGEPMKAMLLGQPVGFPLRDHLLVVNVGIPPAIEVQRPTMIFFGGWDDPPRFGERPGTGCLSAIYPVEEYDRLAQAVGTVDYSQPR